MAGARPSPRHLPRIPQNPATDDGPRGTSLASTAFRNCAPPVPAHTGRYDIPRTRRKLCPPRSSPAERIVTTRTSSVSTSRTSVSTTSSPRTTRSASRRPSRPGIEARDQARSRQEAHADAAPAAPPRDPQRRRGAPPVRELEPAARRVDREEVPVLGSAPARHRAGGQPRPHPRRRQVRLAQGLQVLDVRDLVDPPGDPARHRQLGARHPAASSRRRHAHRAAQAARAARGHDGPHADARRARERGRAAARQGRRSAPLRGRHGLARRAGP